MAPFYPYSNLDHRQPACRRMCWRSRSAVIPAATARDRRRLGRDDGDSSMFSSGSVLVVDHRSEIRIDVVSPAGSHGQRVPDAVDRADQPLVEPGGAQLASDRADVALEERTVRQARVVPDALVEERVGKDLTLHHGERVENLVFGL